MTAAPLANGAPRLEKYELLEEIGHGGMATVYRARDPRLGREVAVKVIHKHLRENAEIATRFVAEARAAAKLRHRGIVEVFDVSSEDDDERFLVVELVRGPTLRKVLQKHRDMPAEVGAAIVLELCDALEHAHESGIIHRDVKPENVLIECPRDRAAASRGPRASRGLAEHEPASEEGNSAPRIDAPVSSASGGGRKSGKVAEGVVVKLTDFGIAKMLDAQGVTSTGQVLGSPAHMAPEQIEGGEVDARTDVFAIGVLMYECMVGHLPFDGKNPAQVLRRVLDGSYAPADRERPTVGGRWAKILASALARDAAARTTSPAALAEQIRAELDALGVNPAQAINAFFDEPSAYTTKLTEQLVPRLVSRGEAARKRRDIPGAAADYNRALALAPNDLSILKRVTSLTSSESRRLFARRAGTILVGSIALGVVTFGVVKWARTHHPVPPASSAEVPSNAATIEPLPPPTSLSTVPQTNASASVVDPKPKATTAHPTTAPTGSIVAATTKPTTALVRLTTKPPSANVSIDDGPFESPFGKQFSLTVGPHKVRAQVQGSKCCKETVRSIEVKAPQSEKTDEVQTTMIQLELNPTVVALVGAPSGSSVACAALGLNLQPGAPITVTLKEVESNPRCEFRSPDGTSQTRSIHLGAGEKSDVVWSD
jgi:serine/threonine-protein kinase